MDYLAMKEAKKKKIIRIILACFVISCIIVSVYCYTHYTFSKFEVYSNGDGTVAVWLKDKYKNTLENIQIPSTIHGKKVIEIRLRKSQVETLILPTELRILDIQDCINLKEITMPDKITPASPYGFITITHNGYSDYPDYSELSQLTLIVKEGSEAEQYAKKHNIAYKYK